MATECCYAKGMPIRWDSVSYLLPETTISTSTQSLQPLSTTVPHHL